MRMMPGRPSARKTMAAPVMSVTFVPRIASTATGSCEVNQPRLPMPIRAAPRRPVVRRARCTSRCCRAGSATTTAASAAAGERDEDHVPAPEAAQDEPDPGDHDERRHGGEQHEPPDLGVDALDRLITLADLRDPAGLLSRRSSCRRPRWLAPAAVWVGAVRPERSGGDQVYGARAGDRMRPLGGPAPYCPRRGAPGAPGEGDPRPSPRHTTGRRDRRTEPVGRP